MGSKQWKKYRVTFSISEEANERLCEVPGIKSAWIEQLILGSTIPEDHRLLAHQLHEVTNRIRVLEHAMTTLDNNEAREDRQPVAAPFRSEPEVINEVELPAAGRGGPGRRRAADPVFQQQMVRLRQAGSSYTEIIHRLRTSHQTVRRILAEHGLD